MDWTAKLRELFKIKVIIGSLLALVLLNLSANHFFVQPRIKALARIENNLHRLQKHYRQLEATDMESISEVLYKQVDYLKTREQNIFERAPSEEELPLLISKLEDRAARHGLAVTSYLSVKKNGKHKQKNKSGQLKPIGIQLKYAGSFLQVLGFLQTLDAFDRRLLINEFEVRRQDNTRVSGEFEFFTMVSVNANVAS